MDLAGDCGVGAGGVEGCVGSGGERVGERPLSFTSMTSPLMLSVEIDCSADCCFLGNADLSTDFAFAGEGVRSSSAALFSFEISFFSKVLVSLSGFSVSETSLLAVTFTGDGVRFGDFDFSGDLPLVGDFSDRSVGSDLTLAASPLFSPVVIPSSFFAPSSGLRMGIALDFRTVESGAGSEAMIGFVGGVATEAGVGVTGSFFGD